MLMRAERIDAVGVIGLGKMGGPIARHLREAGYKTFGHDIASTANEIARGNGVEIAESPAALASRCDLVIVLTAFEEQVEHVIFGVDGAAAGARPGTIIGIAATISPSGTKSIARRLSAMSIIPLDIPLCRPEFAAEAGKLLVTGGGDKEAFERCRPAFETFASDIFHLGPIGSGEVGKMVNNLILWACISANYEGMKLADTFGVNRDTLRAMLLKSSAANWALETGVGDMVMPWAEKDMMIVLNEADAGRVSLPLCGTVKEVIKGIKVAKGDFSGALSKRGDQSL
jgi:3-hydroxyisobutyrate dehydrogenase-like beta-hydroxyacid dehydrogenase